MIRIFIFAVFAIGLGIGHVFADSSLPSPWVQYNLEEYETGIITSDAFEGSACAYIKSGNSDKVTDGWLLQAIPPPAEWLGKRIRLTGYIKTVDIRQAAGMCMKLYTENGDTIVDLMRDRYLRGNTDWTRCEIVMDIPYDSALVTFGSWLKGKGEVRADKFGFEIVNSDVKVTATRKARKYGKPVNLDFEQTK